MVKEVDNEILQAFFGRKMGRAFAFQAPAWDSIDFVTISLTEVVRQKDTDFIKNLNAARLGQRECLRWFNSHAAVEQIKDAISVVPTNKQALQLNEHELDKIKKPLYISRAEISGDVKAQDIPAEEILRIKVDAHVVLLINGTYDSGHGEIEYFNGSLGRIKRIISKPDGTIESVTISLMEGHEIEVSLHTWENKKASIKTIRDDNGKSHKTIVYETIGTFKQIPIKLAYAVSIHKSQGQTYDAANIYPSKIWDAGQLYTALSRCRDIKKMWIASTLKEETLITDSAVQLFYAGKWKNPKKRGGKREGAGRKAKHGATKTIRVPEADVDIIQAFIAGFHGDPAPSYPLGVDRLSRAYVSGRNLALLIS